MPPSAKGVTPLESAFGPCFFLFYGNKHGPSSCTPSRALVEGYAVPSCISETLEHFTFKTLAPM